MNKHIDTALVERAVAGQEQAIQRVLLEMQDLAWALGRDFTGDSDRAQDLAQEILMEIARSLPRLRQPEHAISWCYTLGKRVCMRWAARQVRRQRLWEEFNLRAEGTDPSVAAKPFAEPHAALIEEERRSVVARSLRQLSAQTQETMRLFYIEGCSLADIAARAKASENAIKQRLHAGRHGLRKELEHMPATAEDRQRAVTQPLLKFSHTGSWTGNSEHIQAMLRPLLVQQILLQIAKEPKRIAQIASAVGADSIYVEDHLAVLSEMELVRVVESGTYIADFIIVDQKTQRIFGEWGQSWGRAVAEIVAGRLPDLQAAFAASDLRKQGFDWNDLRWTALPAWVLNAGMRQSAPRRIELPLRPDGNRWYFFARPANALQTEWQSWCTLITDDEKCSFGSFGSPALGYKTSPIPDGRGQKRAMLRRLAGGPVATDTLATDESMHTELAELLAGEYCRKEGEQICLNLPLITEAVDCVLYPVVDDVCRQVIEQVGLSSAKGVAELLEHNGYGHLREQFPVLALSHASSLTNHCFAALVKMGALGEVPSERPAAWGCWMWKGDVRLGRWDCA